jgi:hypothetical protein
MPATVGSAPRNELLGESLGEADGADLGRDRSGVVRNSLDRGADLAALVRDDGEAGARLAVLRLPDRAAVDEEYAGVLPDPGFVGVPEDEHIAVGLGGDAREGALVAVFEQVLVHLPRRAVDEPDALASELQAQVEGEVA